LPFGGTNRIIGKSARKSQNISVVMVFRRSLVRELTATAIALFLVLLGILFTNLVCVCWPGRLVEPWLPEGILALLGFNALFYFNILLSVALFLTVLLTLSRWYRTAR
jgi:lipopolysaccharide export system permease protein